METIIIQPKSKKELEFVAEMLKRLNIKIKILSQEEKKDYGLGIAIDEGLQTKSVSKDSVLNHLRNVIGFLNRANLINRIVQICGTGQFLKMPIRV